MELNDWFMKGISPDDYIESMQTHKENLLHIYDKFQLPGDQAFFDTLKEKNLRVIVLTEDWCGDAMLNIPILLRLSEAANMDVRMLLRDQNLELMDQYLTNGKSRSIPIFIFLDPDGNEVAKWGPRAQKVQQFVDHSKEALPQEDAEDFKEKFKEMLFFITKSFRDNTDFWEDVYVSLKDELNK
ncbi:thioredoxin family protein [Virgibacillus sp. SK37]|uniref:thioredoxin family protein n=1 Tax=Virgibacillus sp. SK37 TaxID=403957 RepID=UPI0004D12885|nr:thioredoxin family protein [Virgibacillus sp. SK37]AIF44007.1 thioredoxin [Virgibacillus sp. SK37]